MKRKTLGIPIRCVDYSNSSQIVSLFTRDFGLLEGIAKGAHRPRNAFQGPFDLAVLEEVVFLERRSTGLAILTEARIVDGFRGLRRRWDRHVAASLIVEFLRHVGTAGEPQADLFELSAAALAAIDLADRGELSELLLRFEIRALRALGFLGAVDACGLCGKLWPGGRRPAFFSPQAGGLLCRGCLERQRSSAPAGAPLPGPAVEFLRGLAVSDGTPAGERRLVRHLHRLLLDACIFFLERPLRMLKYSAVWL